MTMEVQKKIEKKLLSLNFRFNDELDLKREFVALIKKLSPDVVFIEGCTSAIFQATIKMIQLLNMQYVYENIDDGIDHKDTYICMMSRDKIIKKGCIKFDKSNFDRYLLKYVIEVSDKRLHLLVGELDPPSCSVEQRSQIASISNLIKDQMVIFCGNTNIPEWQTIVKLPEGWFDAWREYGSSAKKYTNGTERMDRIWYKNIECTNYTTYELKPGYFAMYAGFEIEC